MHLHRSSSLRATLSLSTLAFLAACGAAQGGGSVTERRLITYTDSNRSIWSESEPGSGLLPGVLIGLDLPVADQSIGGIGEIRTPEVNALPLFFIPSYTFGKTGVKLSFGGGVKAGIMVHPWYDAGSLQYKYVAGIDVTYPRLPAVNQSITVTAKLAGGAGSTYSTSSPQLGAQFGAVAKVSGHAESEAWFLDQNLWNGNVFNFSAGNDAETLLNGGKITKFDLPNDINQILGVLNSTVSPIPIGAEIYRPILETKSNGISADGTMEARAFGKFLSVQTDLASWCFGLIPAPAGPALSLAVHGDVRVPGTDYNVKWDFARFYANLDVGFIAKSSLKPSTKTPPKILLTILNAKTMLPIMTSTTGSATFTMPIEGIIVQPELDLTLSFKNRLAMGVGGEVGAEPIHIAAKGSLGYGTNIAPVDFDFSVGKFVWKPDASEGAQIWEKTFDLPAPVEGRRRTLASIGINAFNASELPAEIYGRKDNAENPFPLYVAAYSYDTTSGNISSDTLPVSLDAGQGRAFFPARATFTATIQKAGSTESYPVFLDGDPKSFLTTVRLRLPTSRLSPGQHSLTLTVDTFNVAGEARKAVYTVPVTAYNPRVSSSPTLYTQSGLEPNSVTNRMVADGQDSRLYIGAARGILNSTQIVLDDGTILPNDFSNLDEIALANQSEGRTVSFTISAGLKSQLAGAPHTVKLRAPSLIRRSDGEMLPPFESEPIPIFVVAGVPRIDSVNLEATTPAQLPIKEGGYVVELKGANFSNATVVSAITPIGAPQELLTEYSKEGVLRVTIPADIMWLVKTANLATLGLRASTPVVQVPADAGHGATTSGGTSATKTITFGYATPSINRIVLPTNNVDRPIMLRNRELTVRVYGDNFYGAQGTLGPATKFTIDGVAIPASRITLPTVAQYAVTVPYYDITLPAESAAKVRTLVATNPRNAVTSSYPISNESAVPDLVNVNGTNRIRVLASGTFGWTVNGGPVYNDSRFVLGGVSLGVGYISESQVGVTTSASVFASIPGKTATGVLRNATPGGGDSDPVTVILEEGNSATLSVSKGVLAFDRATNAWKQEITVNYSGSRTLGDVNVQFRNLPSGIQLLNGNGTDGGFPYKRVAMNSGASVKFVALFRKAGTNAITFTSAVRIP